MHFRTSGAVKEDQDDDDEDDEPAPPKKAAAKSGAAKKTAAAKDDKEKPRKQIPDGIPNALEGLKILFTGTFDAMDRKTSVETAETYGATVVKKLEDTGTFPRHASCAGLADFPSIDYIIMGVSTWMHTVAHCAVISNVS